MIPSVFQLRVNHLCLQGLLSIFEIATKKTVGKRLVSNLTTLMKIQLGLDSLRLLEGRRVDEKP